MGEQQDKRSNLEQIGNVFMGNFTHSSLQTLLKILYYITIQICSYMGLFVICKYVFIIFTTSKHLFNFIIILTIMLWLLNCIFFHID
jgi:hypothetical protein